MKLNELFNSPNLLKDDFAIGIMDQDPDFNPKWSKIVGTIDGRDVWGSRCFGDNLDVFAFRTNEICEAYVVIKNIELSGALPLVRVWCKPSLRGKGLISALLGFVTKKMNNKIIVTKDEPITKDGKDWLIKLIKNPSGFKITAIDGKKISPEDIESAWTDAKNASVANDLQVIIENGRRYSLWGDNYPLKEAAQHLGNSDLD